MINWFMNLNYAYQALIATTFTYLITALGAAIVFLFKKINKNIMDAMLGFAAGVMTAASYFSLLAPAITSSIDLKLTPWLITFIGFLVVIFTSVSSYIFKRDKNAGGLFGLIFKEKSSDGYYEVSGKAIEKMMGYNNFETESGFDFFQKYIEHMIIVNY